jgi:hypothetical protein
MTVPQSRPRRRKPLDAGPLAPEIGSFRLHLAAEGKAAKTVRTYTTEPDRREQRAQVRLEIRGRGRPVTQLDRTAGHCENGTEQPTARTSSPARTNVTGARIANRAQAEAGSSDSSRPGLGAQPGTGPHVRASSPPQVRCRTDFQPVSRLCSQGELAAIATSVGPSRQRR